jgi:zinc transport system ATP-binding protein
MINREQLNGPSITFDKVSLKEGSQVILKPISCAFSAGSWHAILGPNGGGKSTLLKTILGLTSHLGAIQIEWPKNTISSKRPAQGKVGYLPQLMPFDASMPISVTDFLLISLTNKPVWFKRKLPQNAIEALKKINFTDKLDSIIGDLSGGERQRLMLITALLQNPSLLILDEPMTGLDKKGREDVLNLLVNFQQAGGTILMVEHDWLLVQQYCDQVYWIDQGLQKQCDAKEFFKTNAESSIFQTDIDLKKISDSTQNLI